MLPFFFLPLSVTVVALTHPEFWKFDMILLKAKLLMVPQTLSQQQLKSPRGSEVAVGQVSLQPGF